MKNVIYYNNTQKEALEYTSKVVDFGVTLILYSALNEVLNSYVLLRDSKYFVHNIKRRANNILEMRNKKVKELRDIVMHKGFAEAYWDAIIDACEKDVASFKKSIKTILDNNNAPDSDLFAQIETTRVLLEAAKIQYEEVIKASNSKYLPKGLKDMKGLNLFETFHEFYADRLHKEWEAVCSELYRINKTDIDLNNESVTKQFNTLAEKFAKGLYIDECLKAAEQEYPEYAGAKVVIEED